MSMYDLAVIGAGWAGFNAALRAKELGLKVCLIESGRIGGTCLNYGCIPTKAIISCAKIFQLAKKAPDFGVELENLSFNFAKIQERKNKIIQALSQGMRGRLAEIDFIESRAQIISPYEIKTSDCRIKTKFMLIASGSRSMQLPGLETSPEKIISSEQALSLQEIPPSLLIIGGGVIGCEFASLFSILGSKVAIIEKTPFLLPGEDRDIVRKLEVVFKKKGIQVITGGDVSGLNLRNYSCVLVCIGRSANSSGLGLENIGVELDNGRVIVGDYLESSCGNIYAAGDCASKIMLAHYAAYQGKTAVENMVFGNKRKADNKVVPACVFTEPQIASVGLSEDSAIGAGLSIDVHKFDFRASAMARIIDEVDGFIKVISNQETREVIGASIIGPLASELIASFSMAVSARLTVEKVRAMIFAHPTISESISDAV